jgi:hypothetical protein
MRLGATAPLHFGKNTWRSTSIRRFRRTWPGAKLRPRRAADATRRSDFSGFKVSAGPVAEGSEDAPRRCKRNGPAQGRPKSSYGAPLMLNRPGGSRQTTCRFFGWRPRPSRDHARDVCGGNRAIKRAARDGGTSEPDIPVRNCRICYLKMAVPCVIADSRTCSFFASLGFAAGAAAAKGRLVALRSNDHETCSFINQRSLGSLVLVLASFSVALSGEGKAGGGGNSGGSAHSGAGGGGGGGGGGAGGRGVGGGGAAFVSGGGGGNGAGTIGRNTFVTGGSGAGNSGGNRVMAVGRNAFVSQPGAGATTDPVSAGSGSWRNTGPFVAANGPFWVDGKHHHDKDHDRDHRFRRHHFAFGFGRWYDNYDPSCYEVHEVLTTQGRQLQRVFVCGPTTGAYAPQNIR